MSLNPAKCVVMRLGMCERDPPNHLIRMETIPLNLIEI